MNLQTFSVVKFTFFLPRMTDGCEDNTQFRIRPQNCGLRGKAIRHGAARPQVSSISHRNSAPSVIQWSSDPGTRCWHAVAALSLIHHTVQSMPCMITRRSNAAALSIECRMRSWGAPHQPELCPHSLLSHSSQSRPGACCCCWKLSQCQATLRLDTFLLKL